MRNSSLYVLLQRNEDKQNNTTRMAITAHPLCKVLQAFITNPKNLLKIIIDFTNKEKNHMMKGVKL